MKDSSVEVQANVGDVFVIPAGVAHKTFNPVPATSTFKLLTPGEGHGIAASTEEGSKALSEVELSGFAMIGAYPSNSDWDFAEGGEHVGEFEKVWSVPKPARDPVLGDSDAGICGLWH